MNKQPAALLTANYSEHSPDYLGINQYEFRVGAPYLSPEKVVYYAGGPFGVPYWMEGIAVQGTNFGYITAPTPWQASIITHSANTLYTAGQVAYGQAPTSGVYTGVEEAC